MRVHTAHWIGRAEHPAEAAAHIERELPALSELGSDHPDTTLVARSCHATLVGTAGDPAAAAEELSALIPDVEHRFGPGNTASLQVRHHQLYWRAQTGADPALPADPGLLAAADQLIADHRSVLAAGHPLLQEVLHNAAAWRGDTRDAAIIPFDLVSPWVRTARAIEDP
jgi:hypothetical protein